MMTGARARLAYHGNDVALTHRTPEGKARVVYLDRHGKPSQPEIAAEAWPHELRGRGWHIKAIKDAIAALPLEGSSAATVSREADAPRPRGFLHAHFAVARGDE